MNLDKSIFYDVKYLTSKICAVVPYNEFKKELPYFIRPAFMGDTAPYFRLIAQVRTEARYKEIKKCRRL